MTCENKEDIVYIDSNNDDGIDCEKNQTKIKK